MADFGVVIHLLTIPEQSLPLYYRAVIDGEQPKEPPPSSNIYCRYMIPETNG